MSIDQYLAQSPSIGDEWPCLSMRKDEFIDRYFEREPVLFRKSISSGDYSWGDLSREFYAIDASLGQVRVYQNGLLDRFIYTKNTEELNQVSYIHKCDRLEELLSEGASIVVNRFDKISAYVGKINERLRQYLNSTVVGNAYITRGGNGTFGAHWDTHCVFAAQLKGKKRWVIYKPTSELPLQSQTSRQAKGNGVNPTEVVFDGCLEEGDMLYIPRGWWHEVFPVANQPSLHIAFGVHTVKVHDFLRWLLVRKMSEQKEFRESLDGVSSKEGNLSRAVEILSTESLRRCNLHEYVAEFLAQFNSKTRIDFQKIMES